MKHQKSLLVLPVLFMVLAPPHGAGEAQAGKLAPPKEIQRAVKQGEVPDLLFFERRHSLKVGDKGEERFNVSSKPPACGKPALVFDHARIVYKRKRFGEAKIVKSPRAGCVRCTPLVVRWYHEPTGYLEYQVHIYRRKITGKCP